MPLPRGFSSWAEAMALEVRAELGLNEADRIDPLALCDHLGMPVITFADLDLPESDRNLLHSARAVSAITVFSPDGLLVAVNDGHSRERINSSTCHEAAHGLCLHQPQQLERHTRQYDATSEAEADRLAGALLVPGSAARRLIRAGWSDHQLAEHFGCSIEMARWRINASGARRWAA